MLSVVVAVGVVDAIGRRHRRWEVSEWFVVIGLIIEYFLE